jgi:hypothetical protein
MLPPREGADWAGGRAHKPSRGVLGYHQLREIAPLVVSDTLLAERRERCAQDDAMESNKDLKKKYKSVQDYEDDFM